MECISDNAHCWKVCLGVLYITSLWNVGDSVEINCTLKMEWYHQKDKLLLELDHVICHYDVIPLLNTVFSTAFGQVGVNQRVIANHGGRPLNHKLFEHPSHCIDQSAAHAYLPGCEIMFWNHSKCREIGGISVGEYCKGESMEQWCKIDSRKMGSSGQPCQ